MGELDEEIILFTNFCNNYDSFKLELKQTAPQAWQPAISKMGPGKIICPPAPVSAVEPTVVPDPVPTVLPNPEPTVVPETDQLSQELEMIIDKAEMQELAAKSGWSKETLTQTVLEVLKRKNTVDLQGPRSAWTSRFSFQAARAYQQREQRKQGAREHCKQPARSEHSKQGAREHSKQPARSEGSKQGAREHRKQLARSERSKQGAREHRKQPARSEQSKQLARSEHSKQRR